MVLLSSYRQLVFFVFHSPSGRRQKISEFVKPRCCVTFVLIHLSISDIQSDIFYSEIRSKHGQRSVLTVSLPANEPFSEDEEGRTLTYAGCAVTIQQRKNNTYGKSHQRWHYDAETGHIHAFKTNRYDKGTTCISECGNHRFLLEAKKLLF